MIGVVLMIDMMVEWKDKSCSVRKELRCGRGRKSHVFSLYITSRRSTYVICSKVPKIGPRSWLYSSTDDPISQSSAGESNAAFFVVLFVSFRGSEHKFPPNDVCNF